MHLLNHLTKILNKANEEEISKDIVQTSALTMADVMRNILEKVNNNPTVNLINTGDIVTKDGFTLRINQRRIGNSQRRVAFRQVLNSLIEQHPKLRKEIEQLEREHTSDGNNASAQIFTTIHVTDREGNQFTLRPQPGEIRKA